MYFKRNVIKATMIIKQLNEEERGEARIQLEGRKKNLTRMIQAWFRENCEMNRACGGVTGENLYKKRLLQTP